MSGVASTSGERSPSRTWSAWLSLFRDRPLIPTSGEVQYAQAQPVESGEDHE